MVQAISDRGFEPPQVFRQAENTVVYAQSIQNRYNDEIHELLHGQTKENRFNEVIEI